MPFINIQSPSYPFYFFSGNATYRPGDAHSSRKGIVCFNLIVVETGTLYMQIESQKFALHKNDALIIPPNYSHKGYRICSEKTVFHWLHFNTTETYNVSETPNNIISNPANSFTPCHHTLSLPMFQTIQQNDIENVISLMSQLETQTINFYNRSNTIVKNMNNPFYQQELFMCLLQIISISPPRSSVNEIAYIAMQYINTHYAEKITLEQLAKITNCHPTHLIRCVKKQYDMSPNQLLINTRLHRACILLTSTQLPITTISYQVGFSSPSYFGKQFKLSYQCSPKEYRQKFSELE